MSTPRSINRMVEDQLKRWTTAPRKGPADEKKPARVICISRQAGCDSRGLGLELAARLQFDLIDRDLLHQVAESAHLSEAILKTVDEKVRSTVDEWVESLFTNRYLSSDYLRHLSKVLMAIAHHGRAVVLGRGAGYILKQEFCLRVVLVAPLKDRVTAMANQEDISREAARRRVDQLDSERRSYIQQHFHAEMLDPTNYDLVINTAGLSREAVLDTIQAAWEGKRTKV
jgi:cytidylate kinase